jgi:hypothetical protein
MSGSSRRFIDGYSLFLVSGIDVFLTCSASATNNVMPARGGAVAAARRRHGLEVEYEEYFKNFVVIFAFC